MSGNPYKLPEKTLKHMFTDFLSDNTVIWIRDGKVSNISEFDMSVIQVTLSNEKMHKDNLPIFITEDKKLYIGKEFLPKGSEEYTSKMMELTLLGYI